MPSKILLRDYIQKGKKLIPHMLTIPNISMDSWVNNRLPEMLWAALIRTNINRMKALRLFSNIGHLFHEYKDRQDIQSDITLTGIANLQKDFQKEVMDVICNSETSPILGSLLVFNNLPGRDVWMSNVSFVNEELAWGLIAYAIIQCFDHQSEISTDCRLAKLIPCIAMGKIVFVEGELSEVQINQMMNDFSNYPFGDEPKRAAARIRALEGAFSGYARGENPKKIYGLRYFGKNVFKEPSVSQEQVRRNKCIKITLCK